MANVLEMLAIPDLNFLHELADSLDEALSNIAYNGKAEDIKYIKKTQRKFKKKYEKKLKLFKKEFEGNDSSIIDGMELIEGLSGLGNAVRCIIYAYDALQGLLEEFPEARIEAAENAVMEYLVWQDEGNEDKN